MMYITLASIPRRRLPPILPPILPISLSFSPQRHEPAINTRYRAPAAAAADNAANLFTNRREVPAGPSRAVERESRAAICRSIMTRAIFPSRLTRLPCTICYICIFIYTDIPPALHHTCVCSVWGRGFSGPCAKTNCRTRRKAFAPRARGFPACALLFGAPVVPLLLLPSGCSLIIARVIERALDCCQDGEGEWLRGGSYFLLFCGAFVQWGRWLYFSVAGFYGTVGCKAIVGSLIEKFDDLNEVKYE